MNRTAREGGEYGRAATNFRFGPDIPYALWRGLQECPAPVGVPCSWCQEAVADGDSGVVIPHLGPRGGPCDAEVVVARMLPAHWRCHLRSVMGGVAHQLRLCDCCGGDPAEAAAVTAGLSKRQEAEAACLLHAALHCGDWPALQALRGLARLLPPPPLSKEAAEALMSRVRAATPLRPPRG